MEVESFAMKVFQEIFLKSKTTFRSINRKRFPTEKALRRR